MKKLLLLAFVCVAVLSNAQYSPQPFNVSGPATLNMAYSSGQYHYKRTTLDTIYSDGHELLVIDDSTNTTTVTVHFPSRTAPNGATILPYPGEFFSIVSMDTIKTLTLVSNAPLQGTVTTLGANTRLTWVYTYSAIQKAYVWLWVSNGSPIYVSYSSYVSYSDTTATIATKKNLQGYFAITTPTKDSTFAGSAHQSPAVNTTHIIVGASTITADTITLPSATNGQYVDVVFNKAVTTISYGGTNAAFCGFVSATAGAFKRYLYLNGFWY